MNIAQIKKLAGRVLAVPIIRKSINRFQLALYSILSLSRWLAVPFTSSLRARLTADLSYTNAIRQYNRNVWMCSPPTWSSAAIFTGWRKGSSWRTAARCSP